jgi:hypothetical protein
MSDDGFDSREDRNASQHPEAGESMEGIEPEPAPEPDPEPDPPRRSNRLIYAALIIAAAILGNAWMVSHPRAIAFDQTYQAVLLSNNNLYFGRLQGYGTENPVLSEVYYVQATLDPQTQEQTNILRRRGKEWHSPDKMYINPKQIVLVEPVGANSRVAELIKELKLQR